MTAKTNVHLNIIAKSSAFIFIGTILSLLFGFASRIIFVRFTTQNEYGIYSLSLTIISICTTLSALGLQEGVTRHIAHYNSKNEIVQNTIFSSLIIVSITSGLIVIILYSLSDYLAIRVFSLPEMASVIKMLVITVPSTVLINIIVSIYRAFNKVGIKVFIQDVFKSLSYLTFLIVAVLLNMTFKEMIYSYTVSITLTFAFLFLYFLKSPPTIVNWKRIHINKNSKELLKYSLPLLGVSILLTIMSWTDTLMLGLFKNSEVVASYNAAYPIASLLSLVINTIGFMYVPIASQLYSNNDLDELRNVNASSTKWCFMLTFPIFVIIFVFPETILNLFYGIQYTDAGKVLQILLIGTIMNSYFGLNYYTLLSTGKSSLLMFCSFISALLNIILNVFLIPPYGMEGAAIASSFSFILIEIYMTYRLYKDNNIHPFTNNYIKLTLLCICLLFISMEISNLMILTLQNTIIYSAIFCIIYFLLLVRVKILDDSDKNLFSFHQCD